MASEYADVTLVLAASALTAGTAKTRGAFFVLFAYVLLFGSSFQYPHTLVARATGLGSSDGVLNGTEGVDEADAEGGGVADGAPAVRLLLDDHDEARCCV